MDVEARTGPPDPMAAATRYLGGWFVDLGHPDGEPPPLAGTGVVVCLMG